MGTIFLILGYFFIALFLLLLLIPFLPFFYTIYGAKNESYLLFFSLRCLWKIFRIVIQKEENQALDICIVIFGFHIPISVRNIWNIRKKKERSKDKEGEKSKKLKNNTRYFALSKQSFLEPLFKFIRRLFAHILPQKFHFYLSYGFADPADTGMLAALIAINRHCIPQGDILLIPVFDKEMVSGKFCIEGRIILSVIIIYFLQFYFSKGVRRKIKEIRT